MKNIVFLILMILTAGIFATLSIDSYSISSEKLNPGQSGYISITLKNVQPSGATTTGETVENVVLYIIPPKGLTSDKSSVIVGNLEGGTSTTVSFQITALKDAKAGVYTISVTADDKTSNPKTTTIPVIISNKPIFTLQADKDAIKTLDSFNLSIQNDGGKVDRLTIKISSDKFSLAGKDQIYVGDVSKTVTVPVDIDARKADEGVNSIPFVLSYYDEGGVQSNETKTVPIVVKKDKLDITFSQKEHLITSQEGNLTMTIDNHGKEVKNLRFVISDSRVNVLGGTEVKIGDLPENGQTKFSARVLANLQPGLNKITATAKWIEENVEKQEDIEIPVKILSDSNIGVFIEAKPSPFKSGEEHTLSVLISNEGSYDISNVKVSVMSEFFDNMNAETSQYIGSLESDDFSTVQYKIRINALSEGAYPMTVNISYKDKSGEVVQNEIIKEIQVKSPEKKDAGFLPILAIVFIIALGYWYFKMRK